MIFDFSPFLFGILPYLYSVCGTFTGLSLGGLIYEKFTGKKIYPCRFTFTTNYLWILISANVITLLVVYPCADIGANCWMNCFGFITLGKVGYFSNVGMVILVALLIGMIVYPLLKIITGIYVVAYGIIGLIQIGFLEKGLWCIIRSSGYFYLWSSFQLVIIAQYIVYFATVICMAIIFVNGINGGTHLDDKYAR